MSRRIAQPARLKQIRWAWNKSPKDCDPSWQSPEGSQPEGEIYLGSGPAGRAHEILDRQAKRKNQPLRDAQARVRLLMRESDRLWNETWSWLLPLCDAHLPLAGYYRHRGQWRKVRQTSRTRHTRRLFAFEPETDLRHCLRALKHAANGSDPNRLAELQMFLSDSPGILTQIEDLNRTSIELWAAHQYRSDETGHPDANLLERVLIDAVRIAEMNRRHSNSLIEPGAVTALAYSIRPRRRRSRVGPGDYQLRVPQFGSRM